VALRHAVAFVGVVVAVHAPFLLWEPDAVLHAYTEQGGRDVTAESLWYLPLRALGIAHFGTHVSAPADAPEWVSGAATLVQLAVVAGLLALAVRRRGRIASALALAALVPAAFLLTNRIFSPQFLLVLVAAWAVAAAVLLHDRREQLLVGVATGAACVGNAFVYPYALPHYTFTWQLASLLLFAVSLSLTAWLALRAALE
jgi:hypothetical protein